MQSLLDHASRVIPGASLTKSKKAFSVFAERAEGAVIWDTDGSAYIDCLSALGAATLGYRPPPSVSGVTSLRHRLEPEAAQQVLWYVAPWAKWARFTKTGSEACTGAYRIAKDALWSATQTKVLVGDWAFHGWHGWHEHAFRYSLGANLDDTWAGFVDRGWLSKSQLPAAVFVEPHRFTKTNVEWLHHVRSFCDRTGALMIFDSMIYGGRWALGGASEYFGVEPDLEVYGKGLGGGSAVAFIVGKENTRQFAEVPSGTFSGDISGLAGVIDAIHLYTTEPVIPALWARGQRLQAGLRAVVPTELGRVDGYAPVSLRILWNDESHAQKFTDMMLARGIVWHPLVTMVNYAHTENQIDQVVATAKEVFTAWH